MKLLFNIAGRQGKGYCPTPSDDPDDAFGYRSPIAMVVKPHGMAAISINYNYAHLLIVIWDY